MRRALVVCFAVLLASLACGRKPPAPVAPVPPERPCWADEMGLVRPLDAGEAPPAGYRELDLTFDRDLACFMLIPPLINERPRPDGGAPQRMIGESWPTWAMSHPRVGSKLSLAIKDGAWEYQFQVAGDPENHQGGNGTLPARVPVVHLTPGAEQGVVGPFHDTPLTHDVLATHWEKVKQDPRRHLHAAQTLPAFDGAHKIVDGPFVLTSASWDRSAGALTYDLEGPCEKGQTPFVSPHPLSPATPEFIPEGFTLWACPLKSHPKKNFEFEVEGYRPQ